SSRWPSVRSGRARDVAYDLGRYWRGEAIRAKPLTVLERAWRRGKKTSPTLAVLATTCAVLSVVLGLWANQTSQPRELKPAESSPPSGAARLPSSIGYPEPPASEFRHTVSIET